MPFSQQEMDQIAEMAGEFYRLNTPPQTRLQRMRSRVLWWLILQLENLLEMLHRLR